MHYNFIDEKGFNKDIVKAVKQFEKKNGKILIWVFAYWCHHCTIMKPEWKQLQKKAKVLKTFSTLAIENDLYKHLKTHHSDLLMVKVIGNVPHFPYLIKFDCKTNKATIYEGENSWSKLLEFMK